LNIKVKILPGGSTQEAARGTVLADILKKAGVAVNLRCGRRGVCGTCAVEIVRGPRPPLDDDERSVLARRKMGVSGRLACRYVITEDLSVRVPAASRPSPMPILTRGVERRFVLDPLVRKIRFSLPKFPPSLPSVLGKTVRGMLSRSRLRLSADVLAEFERRADSTGSNSEFTAVLRGNADVMVVEAGDTTAHSFGLAIDLGTTTIVVELVDLNSGRTVGHEAGINPQVSFGADVVSRISAAYADPAQAAALRTTILEGLNGMILRLLGKHHLSRDLVYEAVIAGNTAMNHFFLGTSVLTLAVSPFAGAFSVLKPVPATQAGLDINPRGQVYIAPNIESFVGGDISAGLIATGFDTVPGTRLFVDLGTNGEIVLKTGKRLLTTSTAAGPAFEGMTIGCGMLAETGAVYRVEDKDGYRLRTIGGGPPRGVCGTGLIDILSVALRRGQVTSRGRIIGPESTIELGSGLALEQRDVREFQLAAAAVKTGLRLLLDELRLEVRDLDGLVVAGAFGNSLNIRNAITLGLLPRLDPKKIVFVGNASLTGARVLLLSRTERSRCERLVRRIRHISLASRETFQKTFVEALAFEPWA
jgi:uncharacterized 2Fe-2S/4Fe-4S cluster protein (DUF4445 family)